jgi:hypothetical protein
MANIIKIKRGLKKDLPVSSENTAGELRYALDTNELFIDNGTENKLINNLNVKVDKVNKPLQLYGTDASGNQVTYDKNYFGLVDDVKVGDQSVVTLKVAELNTMALENADEYTKSTGFADIAFSGNYEDLSNKPDLSEVAISGEYEDLINKPTLSTVATSGKYEDLLGKPILSTVATSGDYNDLLNTPTLSAVATSGKYEDLLDKPILSTVALTGNYEDLSNKPFIPTTKADIGLGNVDNTSDLDKPISDATQAALDQKADKSELDDKVNIIDLVKDVQNISSAQIYTSINDLPILDASKNGTRYVALTDGELPLVIYSWDNPTQTWEKIDTIRGSSLYIDIQTSILYYYRSSIPYLREVGIHNWGKIIGNIENQTDLMNLLSTKQNNLTMGTNMEITNNTISTTATQIIRRRW